MSVGLENVKAGDKVGLSTGRSGQWVEATVERTTATQIIVRGSRFRRSNGYQINSSSEWYKDRIAALDHIDSWSEKTTVADLIEKSKVEIFNQQRRRMALDIIRVTTWRDQSTETIEAIAALLTKTG